MTEPTVEEAMIADTMTETAPAVETLAETTHLKMAGEAAVAAATAQEETEDTAEDEEEAEDEAADVDIETLERGDKTEKEQIKLIKKHQARATKRKGQQQGPHY